MLGNSTLKKLSPCSFGGRDWPNPGRVEGASSAKVRMGARGLGGRLLVPVPSTARLVCYILSSVFNPKGKACKGTLVTASMLKNQQRRICEKTRSQSLCFLLPKPIKLQNQVVERQQLQAQFQTVIKNYRLRSYTIATLLTLWLVKSNFTSKLPNKCFSVCHFSSKNIYNPQSTYSTNQTLLKSHEWLVNPTLEKTSCFVENSWE